MGCIARDRGQIWDASVWFKDALDVDQVNMITIHLFAC